MNKSNIFHTCIYGAYHPSGQGQRCHLGNGRDVYVFPKGGKQAVSAGHGQSVVADDREGRPSGRAHWK